MSTIEIFLFLIKRVLWSPVSKMFREETVLEFNVHSAYDSPDVYIYILKKVLLHLEIGRLFC